MTDKIFINQQELETIYQTIQALVEEPHLTS